MKIFYLPVTNKETLKNYKRSVQEKIALNGKAISEILPDRYSNIDCGLWGFREGNHNKREYEKISKGDVLFFRTKDKDGYQCLDGFAYIYGRFVDEEVSELAWGDSSYKYLLLLGEYISFSQPFRLTKGKTIESSLRDVPEAVWHSGYNMFRQWDLKGAISEQDLIESFREQIDCQLVYRVGLDVKAVRGQIKIPETARKSLLKVRVGQDKFRKKLLEVESKCRVCGLDIKELLKASHIKPWANSTSSERLDVNNGLLLCPNHDGLFDKGYISFQDDGRILISDEIDEDTRFLLNVDEDIKIFLSESNKDYMEWHRKELFNKKYKL